MERPETRYARSGDYHIAYQVLGAGSVDLVYVPGWYPTSTVRDLVAGSGAELEDRGAHSLRGVEARWKLFAAAGETRGP